MTFSLQPSVILSVKATNQVYWYREDYEFSIFTYQSQKFRIWRDFH